MKINTRSINNKKTHKPCAPRSWGVEATGRCCSCEKVVQNDVCSSFASSLGRSRHHRGKQGVGHFCRRKTRVFSMPKSRGPPTTRTGHLESTQHKLKKVYIRAESRTQATAPAHSQTECVVSVCVGCLWVWGGWNLAAGALTTFCTAQGHYSHYTECASPARRQLLQPEKKSNNLFSGPITMMLRLSTALTHPPPGEDEIKWCWSGAHIIPTA